MPSTLEWAVTARRYLSASQNIDHTAADALDASTATAEAQSQRRAAAHGLNVVRRRIQALLHV